MAEMAENRNSAAARAHISSFHAFAKPAAFAKRGNKLLVQIIQKGSLPSVHETTNKYNHYCKMVYPETFKAVGVVDFTTGCTQNLSSTSPKSLEITTWT